MGVGVVCFVSLMLSLMMMMTILLMLLFVNVVDEDRVCCFVVCLLLELVIVFEKKEGLFDCLWLVYVCGTDVWGVLRLRGVEKDVDVEPKQSIGLVCLKATLQAQDVQYKCACVYTMMIICEFELVGLDSFDVLRKLPFDHQSYSI